MQRADGSLPYTAPNPNRQAGGGIYWSTFPIEAAWQSYIRYGDRRPMERYYPMMQRWMEYLENHKRQLLLQPLPERWYLGDWATPAADSSAVIAKLKELTATRFADHLVTGLVGVPVITQWATREHQSEWLYRLLKQRTSPGYLYMIDHGATTTWEHWEGRRSRIHNCFNGIGSWFYEALVGIQPDAAQPAYRHFTIAPQPVGDISWAEATKSTPYGPIAVRWQRNAEGRLTVSATLPVGTSATVCLPSGKTAEISSGEHHISE